MPSDESSCPALSSYTQVNRRSFFIYKSILSTLFLSSFLTLVCFAWFFSLKCFICNIFWSYSSHFFTHPTLYVFCLSCSLLKIRKNWERKKLQQNKTKKPPQNWKSKLIGKSPKRQKNIPKQIKVKQKVHKNAIEFVLYWSTSPGHWNCPGLWLVYPEESLYSSLIMVSALVFFNCLTNASSTLPA